MRFSRDRRGQSVVIGTVVLFGFLIVALSLYQVQVVPQQNAEAEFQHSGEVRNDLVEVRAGVLQAGSIDQPQYRTVRLGTSYSNRVFTINPPAPAGTIRTTESYPITIAYESNGTVIETIPTRFLQYRPGYNELDRSPTWYDASVLYLDATDDGGGIAVIEGQELVIDGGDVRIVALQNEFSRSETGRVTLELRPAEEPNVSIPEGGLTVTVPTRLSGDEYWNEADIPTNTFGNITNDENGDDVYNLTLETTADNLTVDTVGVQEAPENPTQNLDGVVGGGSDSGDGGDGSDGGGTSSAESTQVVDGTPSTSGGSGRLLFDITTDTEVRIDAVGIETTGNLDSVGARNSNSKFIIDGTESTRSGSTDGGFDYQFNPSVSVQGETELEFNQLDTGIENIRNTDVESNAGIIVSLRFDDGSIKQLFFEADERQTGGGPPN